MTKSVAREPVVDRERAEPEVAEISRHREQDYLVQSRLEAIRRLEGYRGQANMGRKGSEPPKN